MIKEPKKPKGFVVFYDYREHLELLTDEERGRLFMALFEYGETGEVPALEGVVRMAFSFMKTQMDRDAAKYSQICQKRSEAGKQGGRPHKTDDADSEEEKANGLYENQNKAKKANAFSEKQMEAKKANTNTNINTKTNTNTNINISLSSSFEEGDIPEEQPKLSPIEIRFAEFWSAYPRKVGKQHALKAWNKIKPTADLHSRIIKAIANQKKSDQWCRENGRFIPNPATWLNGGYWDNEVEEVKPNEINSRPTQPIGTSWTQGFVPAD